MIKVYFEIHHKYAQLVAYFDNEETYNACSPALERLAKKNGFNIVTESVEENIDLQELDRKLEAHG